MKEPSKAAVIYARYSSERQNEQSIEGQLTVIKAFAERENYSIVETYVDRALSGRSDDRPSFQKMIDDSKKGEFQYVIVYKLDRFSRDRYDSAIYKRKLKLNGVRVVSATERIDDSPEGVIFESILEGYAEYYSAELAQKVRRGNQESRKKGLYTGGSVVYGYKVKDKKYYINEKEAEVVKLIYKKSVAGKKMKDIAELLNSKSIPYKDNQKWDINKIKRVLSNEKYIGIVKAGGETYDNICPPIVSPYVFEKSRKLIKKRMHSYRLENHLEYYLSEISYCAKCGENIVGMSGKSKNHHTIYHYYSCSGRRKHSNCDLPNFSKQYLEDIVYDTVLDDLMTQDTSKIAKDIFDRINRRQKDVELNALKLRLLKVKNEIRNLIEAIMKGSLGDDIKEALEKNEKEKKTLEEKIRKHKDTSPNFLESKDVEEFVKSLKDIDEFTDDFKKNFVLALVDSIYVDADKIEIRVYPTYEESSNSDKESTRTIVKNIEHKTYAKSIRKS